MNVGAIICAAGASSRFGGKRKKPFVDVGGRAAFLRSVELFSEREDVKQIVLAICPEDEELVKLKWGANLQFFNVEICYGGKERFETVSKALEVLREDIGLVAVHDAVRCCVTNKWLEAVIKEGETSGAAMLASPVVATLKEVKDKKIVRTVSREGLWEAQTPQVFEKGLLKEAYGNAGEGSGKEISDDSQLVEAMGREVSIVESDGSNIKLTRGSDVAIAEAIIKSRPKSKPKGYVGPFAEAQW